MIQIIIVLGGWEIGVVSGAGSCLGWEQSVDEVVISAVIADSQMLYGRVDVLIKWMGGVYCVGAGQWGWTNTILANRHEPQLHHLNIIDNMKQHSKLEKFEKVDKLGQGTYGVVYKVRDKQTDQMYALKKIRLESEQEGIPSTAIREISILKQLNHPNIVKLFDVVHSNRKLVLVFEYVEYDLKKFMSKFPKDKGMDPMIVKALCYQLLKGVEVCHNRKILHRDLKPQNLLISNDRILKLADFGLARASAIPVKSYTHQVVTLWYRPPDVLLGSQKYSTEIDIWSVGCIFAEMANMKPLFPGQKDEDELQKIFKVVGTPNLAKWPGVEDLPQWKNYNFQQYEGESLAKIVPRLDERGIDLLEKLLRANPAQRISATQALKHPYFSDLPEYLSELYQKLQKQ